MTFLTILCLVSVLILIFSLIVIAAIPVVLYAMLSTFNDYVNPVFSSVSSCCSPAGNFCKDTVNTIEFKYFPRSIRDLCGFL